MSHSNNYTYVRVEEIKPFEIAYGKKTGSVWFTDENIEECISATEKLKIEHIHLQTTTIDFLDDPRLQNVKGMAIQFEIENLSPLFHFKH